MANRRLQVWGGQLTGKNVLFSQSLPPFVEVYPNIIERLQSTGLFHASAHKAPNHIIVNEYLPGQGIMPHQDGPAYHPVVATISLGSYTSFHYYKYTTGTQAQDATDGLSPGPEGVARIIDPTPVMSVLLEPRSVIITSGSLYTSHLHGRASSEIRTLTASLLALTMRTLQNSLTLTLLSRIGSYWVRRMRKKL
ncbi:hypothetical protein J3R30DRAFT_3462088 [Lentinula aciculospora]|uniref:Fe2OG dioxygenase domain-containing protein n=1 Tax=Lentinula aciculospora TaxID=153920 RepID=A0A9W9AEI6_9AGAR|nr:hypothetical protein J3R30DRAFT_3462088 [Lentinula aciculospora]